MKKFSFLILCSIFLSSCSASDDDISEKNKTADYLVHENASLKISESEFGTFVEIVEGDQLVFEYTFSEPGDPQIADSGYNEYLYFEMPAGTENFQLTSNDFEERNTFLRRSCFCVATDFRRVTSGEIIAEKTGDLQWDITFEVSAAFTVEDVNEEYSGTIDFADSGVFQPE